MGRQLLDVIAEEIVYVIRKWNAAYAFVNTVLVL